MVINKKTIFFKLSPKKRNILNYISFNSILAPKLDNFSTISAYPRNKCSTFVIVVLPSAFKAAKRSDAAPRKSVASTSAP